MISISSMARREFLKLIGAGVAASILPGESQNSAEAAYNTPKVDYDTLDADLSFPVGYFIIPATNPAVCLQQCLFANGFRSEDLDFESLVKWGQYCEDRNLTMPTEPAIAGPSTMLAYIQECALAGHCLVFWRPGDGKMTFSTDHITREDIF